MRVLLIGFAKLKYMPYKDFYLHKLDCGKQEVHFLYWNRNGKPEAREPGIHYHEFVWPMEDDIPKLKKLRGFWAYRVYAQKLLQELQFDLIIVMHSIPAVLLNGILVRNYSGRFIFDYRDETYESFAPYRKCIHRAVEASYVTFVSSDGFRHLLPASGKIMTSHNLSVDVLHNRLFHRRDAEHPLRIGFWGYIRHEQLNCALIDRLAGDSRFELHFYGREQAIAHRIRAHAADAQNVWFHGAYQPQERLDFANQTDLLHNLYSNTEAPPQRDAMTNKYYDGIGMYLPQLCMPDSFMGKRVQEQGVGLVCDPSWEDFGDRIWNYYHGLDALTFQRNCDLALERVLEQYNRGSECVERILDGTIE